MGKWRKVSAPWYSITAFRHSTQEKGLWNPAQTEAPLLQKDNKCRVSFFKVSIICSPGTEIKDTFEENVRVTFVRDTQCEHMKLNFIVLIAP